MNRLAELQEAGEAGGSTTFSPTNSKDDTLAPSAAPAGAGDDGGTKKGVTFVGVPSDDPDGADGAKKDGFAFSEGGGFDTAETREGAYVVVQDEELDHALKLIEEIQQGNREIQSKTVALKNQTAMNMKNFNPAADADEGTEAIQDIMDSVSTISKTVKGKLDELSEETKKLQATKELAANHAATIKIQQNQHNHLTRTFMQYINEYNSAVSDNDRQLRDQAVRRIKLKYTKSDGSTVSDEEARQMAAQVLEFGRTDMLFAASKEMLAQVLETRQDILRIERSMRELKSIMDDLSALINEQGEIMDQVLTNVQTSVQYVQSGNKKLKEAKEHAEAASSKMKYMVCCVAVIFLIILAIVLGVAIPV